MLWKDYHTIWITMLFGWIMVYMTRMALTPCLTPMMQEFNLTHADAGLLFAVYFYSYMAMQLPSGYLGDRIGRKSMLLVGAVCWTSINFLVGLARTILHILILRFGMGVAQGTYFGNDRSLVSAYTPKDRMGVGQGLSLIGMGLGLGLGLLLGGILAQTLGWRLVFIILSMPAFLVIFLFSRFLKEPPRIVSGSIKGDGKSQYRLAFRSRDLLLLYLAGLLISYGYWMLGTWTPKIFLDVGVKELAEASTYSSLIGFSAIPSLLIIGSISDRMSRKGKGRKSLAAVQCIPLALFLSLLAWGIQIETHPWILALYVFFAGFFYWAVWPPIFAIIADIVPRDIYGTVFGFINMMGMVSAIFAPWLTGLIRDATGSFVWGLYIAGLLAIVSGLALFGVKPAFKAGQEVPIIP